MQYPQNFVKVSLAVWSVALTLHTRVRLILSTTSFSFGVWGVVDCDGILSQLRNYRFCQVLVRVITAHFGYRFSEVFLHRGDRFFYIPQYLGPLLHEVYQCDTCV